MDKKIFERYEIRTKEEKIQCLPHFQFSFYAEPIEYSSESFLELKDGATTQLYYQDRISLPYLDGQIIAFIGQPKQSYVCQQTNRRMYKLGIAYLKTQENQKIFDCDKCEIIEILSEHQGILEFLDIHLIPYDDFVRVAIEHKYSSMSRDNLRRLTLKIVEIFFIFDKSYLKKMICTQSYTKGEFKEIFDNSNRNKKIVFYSDIVDNNGTEILNSIRHEYSLKYSAKLGDIIGDFMRNNFSNHNAKRYVIKCEDSESKTASFEGGVKDFENLHDWVHPARITCQNEVELFLFLNKED